MEVLKIYEDNHFVVLDKPSGLLSHPSKIAKHADDLVKKYKDQEGVDIYPLSRLDRSTSGILVYIKPHSGYQRIQKDFAYFTRSKDYIALVRGKCSSLQLFRALKEDKKEPSPAISKIEYIKSKKSSLLSNDQHPRLISMVKISIESGKQHQIRKHLSGLGHPILGDTNYGDNNINKILRSNPKIAYRLWLHSNEIHFERPIDNKKILLESKSNEIFKAFDLL